MSGPFIASLSEDQRTIHDALCNSSYIAGLKAGWNAGCIKDGAQAQQAYYRLMRACDGHLSGYSDARTALAAAVAVKKDAHHG